MGDVLKLSPGRDPERASFPTNYNGHAFVRGMGGTACTQCHAFIKDDDVYDAPGTVQEAIDALLKALLEVG